MVFRAIYQIRYNTMKQGNDEISDSGYRGQRKVVSVNRRGFIPTMYIFCSSPTFYTEHWVYEYLLHYNKQTN